MGATHTISIAISVYTSHLSIIIPEGLTLSQSWFHWGPLASKGLFSGSSMSFRLVHPCLCGGQALCGEARRQGQGCQTQPRVMFPNQLVVLWGPACLDQALAGIP
jgi:hypothetical protein